MKRTMFQPRFEAAILAGTKTTIIRAKLLPLGERSLRVWTGRHYARKQRAFARARIVKVRMVRITLDGIEDYYSGMMSDEAANAIARAEGFTCFCGQDGNMLSWFVLHYKLPFTGFLHTFECERT